jgi:hypothetical protein
VACQGVHDTDHHFADTMIGMFEASRHRAEYGSPARNRRREKTLEGAKDASDKLRFYLMYAFRI